MCVCLRVCLRVCVSFPDRWALLITIHRWQSWFFDWKRPVSLLVDTMGFHSLGSIISHLVFVFILNGEYPSELDRVAGGYKRVGYRPFAVL